jgi:indolepyruvate decarboxylase
MGLYQGALSHDLVRKQVEGSDCVLSLGVWMTDLDTGAYSARIDESRLISGTTEQVRIGHHLYLRVMLADFIAGLTSKLVQRSFLTSHPAAPLMPRGEFRPQTEAKLTVRRFFEGLNAILEDNMILMVEPGEAFCTAPYLQIEEAENFIVQAYYCSIGYCVPAALGVSLARPEKRPVVLAGDGAFQMTAQEISSLIRFHCNPVIFLLNNGGYMIERKLHDDGLYNDIQNWRFHGLPAIFGENSISLNVKTEGDLENALRTLKKETQKLIFIELSFPSDVHPSLLR